MGLFGDMFSGMGRGISSLFGGGEVQSTQSPLVPVSSSPIALFNGETATSNRAELFDGQGKPIPPAALTSDGLAHVYTSASLWNAANKSYSWRWDEAYRRSHTDALAMRRDCFLQGLLMERQFPSIQMPWSIEPENKKDPAQVEEAAYLTRLVEAMPDITGIKEAMLDGIWYGRAAAMLQWDWQWINNEKCFIPVQYYPVNGDKIQFTWDGIPEIMIYSAGIAQQLEREGCETRITDRWRVAVFSRQEWRDRLVLYKHDCKDADFFESEMNGGVHGVGVRNWIYWADYIRKEVGSYLLDFMQRVGSGFNVYYYEPGNATAQQEAITIAKTQGRNTWIVWPRPAGKDGSQKGVERIEPGTGNADVLRNMMEYHDDKMERFIVGQTMSGGSDNESGLGGSGRANFAKDTKNNIIKSDCGRLDKWLTSDLLRPLQRYNRPQSKFRHRWISSINSTDPKQDLEAAKIAWEMGVSFDEDEVRQKTGFKKPSGDSPILKNPQIAAAAQQGQPGQSPPGQNGSVFQGQPSSNGNGIFHGEPSGGHESTRNVFEGQPSAIQGGKDGPPERYEFKENDHPRADDGKFGSGGGGTATKDKPTKAVKKEPEHHPGAAHGSSVKVKLTKKMAAPRGENGKIKPVPTKITLSKQETGRVAEATIKEYLKSIVGISDTVGLNAGKPNESIDLFGDSMAPEVKGGICSVGEKAQQWRITFSMELGKAEQAAYDGMSEDQQKAWREKRQRDCLKRKNDLLKKLSKKFGKDIKAVTFTGIVNPDTKTVDIYKTEGYHQRIGWNDPKAKHVASVEYSHAED